MSKRGVLIAIEGSDSTGKATQSELLRQHLIDQGYQVELVSFPRYDEPSSYFVKRYLNGGYGTIEQVGPYTCSLFYALDRYEAIKDIRLALDQGKIVIANRYTGSSMAHQGAKIDSPEERRGYFIWLDHLEFEMLEIPRPDINLVLSLPVSITDKLMENRPKLSYTDKQRDLHESSADHLQTASNVFQELTELFHRDFHRIDCLRNGQLLSPGTIHDLIWGKVKPLLPVSEASSPKTGTSTKTDLQEQEEFTIPNVSLLLAQEISKIAPTSKITYPAAQSIYQPKTLGPSLLARYQDLSNQILKTHNQMVSKLAGTNLQKDANKSISNRLMPLSMICDVTILGTKSQTKLIFDLLNNHVPEAQAAGARLMADAIAADPGFLQSKAIVAMRNLSPNPSWLNDIDLNENYSTEQGKAVLIKAYPMDELDTLAEVIYSDSNLPLLDIKNEVSTWPTEKKTKILMSAVRHGHDSIIENVRYDLEIIGSYQAYLGFKETQCAGLALQAPSPRLGYSIPTEIENSELVDLYQQAFDTSLELYSLLQKEGMHKEARYAVLYGHNLRWRVTIEVGKLKSLLQIKDQPEPTNLIQSIVTEIKKTHPTIASLL